MMNQLHEAIELRYYASFTDGNNVKASQLLDQFEKKLALATVEIAKELNKKNLEIQIKFPNENN